MPTKYTDDKNKSPDELAAEIQALRQEVEQLKRSKAKIKETKKELKESEEKYKRIIDNSLEGIYIAQDFVLKYCNQRMAEMFGFQLPEEAVGLHIKKLVTPKFWPVVEREVRAREEGEKKVSHYQFTGRRIDGSDIELETLSSRIMYKGKPAVQGVVRDVSRQYQLERQLRQAQKMEAIGTLAGGIAHDFNNILSVIIGYTELSQEANFDKTKIKHNLGQVLKASYRARDLVQQILSFSRKKDGEIKPVRVNPIVKEVLKLIRASLPANITIKQDISDYLYVVLAESTQLHQVMMNLCTNAAHAMKGESGTLSVSLSDLNRDLELLDEENEVPPPYLRLTVSDTGRGMTPEVMERIFDPFFTTKRVGEGTGLGLSVVHGIVKSLDGEITVESELGKGTSFHLFLPTYNETPLIDENKPRPAIRGGTERILLVDDEVALASMGRKILEQLGYKVTSRTNSIEALELFRADPEKFDLVLTDNAMPRMTGVEMVLEIHKTKPGIPIILCTGFGRGIEQENIEDLGIKALILKPYSKEDIAKTIREVLDSS